MTAPQQQVPALNAAVATWFRMDSLLGTPLGERAWKEHWAVVLHLRRSYAGFCALFGLFSAGAAGVVVALLGLEWQQNGNFPLTVLPFVLTPVVLGGMWKRKTAVTVAPFLGQRRHVWCRWLFSLLFPVVLILGVFVPWSPAWTAVAALLCAAPWWLSAVLELRRPAPPYPAAWSAAA
ncbi:MULTISPECIES: hypothetical protein [unclassified Nocardiopsis]|uniref:hypothetical protein n=1 Tax=unclassified Nocardiopsis TaxID=2649073 RepID=UPI001358A2EA|nr:MULTISPECIES: hypothetical protein [unclassified Nocardiopsis]